MARDLKDLWLWGKKNIGPFWKRLVLYLRTSWKSIAVIFPCVIAVYYGLGSYFSENIDKKLQFAPKVEGGSAVQETISQLIEREIDKHMYTPNLPFLFPAYILDNMPAYQTGIILSLSNVLHTFSLDTADENLKKTDELLAYPVDVWLFSKTKDFRLEPSSPAQYRKARQYLLKIKPETFYNLKKWFEALSQDLSVNEKELWTAIQSESFLKADDAFYRAQGRLYVVYVLLKAIEKEEKIALQNVYEPLEQAILSEPFVVRNGRFGSSFVPNHLLELAYLTLKSKEALLKEMQNYVY